MDEAFFASLEELYRRADAAVEEATQASLLSAWRTRRPLLNRIENVYPTRQWVKKSDQRAVCITVLNAARCMQMHKRLNAADAARVGRLCRVVFPLPAHQARRNTAHCLTWKLRQPSQPRRHRSYPPKAHRISR